MGVTSGALVKGQEDWYKVELAGGRIVSIAFTAGEDADGDMSITLLSPEESEIWSQADIGPGVTESASGLTGSSASGIYYIVVAHGQGSYTIELSQASQNDADTGGDAGDGMEDALKIETGMSVSAQIGDLDYEDWYAFDVPDGHILKVAFTPDEDADGQMSIKLFSPDQSEIWSQSDVGPMATQSVSQMMGSSSGGVYYLKVYGGRGSYGIDLFLDEQDDAGSGEDAGDRPEDALPIYAEATLPGQIGDFDHEDWYQFAPEVGLTISFTPAEAASGPMTVQVFGPDGTEIWSQQDAGPGATAAFDITEVAGEPYYIQISGSQGSYTIELYY